MYGVVYGLFLLYCCDWRSIRDKDKRPAPPYRSVIITVFEDMIL